MNYPKTKIVLMLDLLNLKLRKNVFVLKIIQMNQHFYYDYGLYYND